MMQQRCLGVCGLDGDKEAMGCRMSLLGSSMTHQ